MNVLTETIECHDWKTPEEIGTPWKTYALKISHCSPFVSFWTGTPQGGGEGGEGREGKEGRGRKEGVGRGGREG